MPCRPWWIEPCDVIILLFTTHINYGAASPARYNPLKLEVRFCVRGVVSPLLANLFLHYAFDVWMARQYPHLPFERYADDAIVHCRTKREAEEVWAAIGNTLLYFDKDGNRRAAYRTFTAAGARLEARTILVEPERILLGADPLGIFAFARPEKARAGAAAH